MRVRKVKSKKGVVREQHDLIVNIDLVSGDRRCRLRHISVPPEQEFWELSTELVADLKEVFMLFDKDEDGVLSFHELEQARQMEAEQQKSFLRNNEYIIGFNI